MRVPALRPEALFAAAVVAVVLGFQLWLTPANPPGFHHDEAAFALNAYTIAHHLRDQDGAFLPIVFPSYADYKSALFSYVLAPVFLVFEPSRMTARWTAVAFGLGTLLLIALVAYRRAGTRVALTVLALAGSTPWLFDLSREAYDSTTVFPFGAALVVATVHYWERGRRRPWLRAAAPAAAFAFVTYSYAGGRLLGPLLALALLVFARRSSVWEIASAWVAFVVLLVPLGVYRIRHPHGLTARYEHASFVTPGMSNLDIVWHAVRNYFVDLDPYHWLVAGDPKPYIAMPGAPALLAACLVVAAIGAVDALRRRDRYWLFVLAAYLLSAVPASLTGDRHAMQRLAAMPVFVSALAIPGAIVLWRSRRSVLLAGAVGLATLVQWAMFVQTYSDRGHEVRVELLDSDVPSLLASGFADGRTIYVDHDDPYGRTMAGWYAVSHGLPLSRVVRLGDGYVPPLGSMVFGRTQACDYVCVPLGAADSFFLARAAGPKPSG